MTLSSRIKKLAEFERDGAPNFVQQPGYLPGAEQENARLRPLLTALAEACEALESIGKVDHPSVADKTSWIVMTESICLLARKQTANITALVEKMESER